MRNLFLCLSIVAALSACGAPGVYNPGTTVDDTGFDSGAAMPDSGPADSGTLDAAADAGVPDSGPADSGSPDSGYDAGQQPDGGNSDSGSPDGGTAFMPQKLLFAAIDGLHPAYLDLNARGNAKGKDGDWLMPNVRRHLENSVWFRHAKDYLPSATDMNHMNVMAGTNSSLTGIFGVNAQIVGFDKDGQPVAETTSIKWARDDRGRPVDTLFAAWKRARPKTKSAMISGKTWIADMFNQPEQKIDFIVTGDSHPAYVAAPEKNSFCDPPTDEDGKCDPESWDQGHSLISNGMQTRPLMFPPDYWTVDAALAVLEKEKPDFTFILLAQNDDAGHALGAAWDPDERTNSTFPYFPPAGCQNSTAYQLRSSANQDLFIEPMLDAMRDVDKEFGRLMDGLVKMGVLEDTMIVFYSDHGMLTHLKGNWNNDQQIATTDYYRLVLNAGLGTDKTIFPFGISSLAGLYWKGNKDMVAAAKTLLQAHKAVNPRTGVEESPWWVLDRQDMIDGVPEVTLPGEMYHKWFVDEDKEQTIVWPDLILLAKNGWQLAAYGKGLLNIGIDTPGFVGPYFGMAGGHGSVDTQSILVGITMPGVGSRTVDSDIRIADLPITAASIFGLTLTSTTIGKDLSEELLGQ
jgi:hypothetical protein